MKNILIGTGNMDYILEPKKNLIWEKYADCFAKRLLIAALILSVGYYSAPYFFYNSKILNCIGALSFFCDTKRSIGFFTGSTIRSDDVLT